MINSKIKVVNILCCVFCAVISIVVIAATPQLLPRTNFSGTWVLDTANSQFGKIPQRAAIKKFEVNQQEDSIYIRKVTIGAASEEVISSESISLNGNECISILDNMRTKTSSVTWSEGGETMTTTSTYSVPNDPSQIDYKLLQSWSLTNGGKKLIVTLMSPGYTIKPLYDKQ